MGDMCCTFSAQDVSLSLFCLLFQRTSPINIEAPNVGTGLQTHSENNADVSALLDLTVLICQANKRKEVFENAMYFPGLA